MALASTAAFASFDINANTNIEDISSVLSEALILDFEFMGRGITTALDDPVYDTTFYWNEEALNADIVTLSASATSTATTFGLTTGHGARTHIGDLLVPKAINSTEVVQVDAITTDTVTVTRSYNATVNTSHASGATFAVVPAFQEASDFSTDKSQKPIARNNFTQIMFAGDLLISRTQLQRKMATVAMDIDRQLANRAIELKRYWTTACLYGEKSSSSGSDSVYRTTLGLRGWIRDNSGVTNSTSEAISMAVLDTHNTTVVDKGEYVDTLLIGTDTVDSVNAIDASNRRMMESERKVGYVVQNILLGQGNSVEVVVDGRVKTGDAFLYKKGDLRVRPFDGAAMFTIAATDFVDGVKRRIGSEMGVEYRHPDAGIALSNKT